MKKIKEKALLKINLNNGISYLIKSKYFNNFLDFILGQFLYLINEHKSYENIKFPTLIWIK